MVIFEEFAKAMARNRAMQRFGMNFAEEMRHRPVSAVGGMQDLEDFPKGLWGAADNHVVFGLSNPRGLLVDLRPTLLRAGGQTLNAGDDGDPEE